MNTAASVFDDLRKELAQSLGFDNYPDTTDAEPYLTYIESQSLTEDYHEDYIRLFIQIIRHFTNQPQNTVDSVLTTLSTSTNLCFSASKPGSPERREYIEDAVLWVIGVWTLMLSSFVVVPGGIRKIIVAYQMRTQDQPNPLEPYKAALSSLVKSSGLLPGLYKGHLQQTANQEDIIRALIELVKILNHNKPASVDMPSGSDNSKASVDDVLSLVKTSIGCSAFENLDEMESLQSLSIDANYLNAWNLKIFGAVEIEWTYNLSRHMVLSKRGGQHYLQLFALPCALEAMDRTHKITGIPTRLLHEIKDSYSMLFNAWSDNSWHARLGFRICCLCSSCSAYRYRTRTLDLLKRTSFCSKRGRDSDQSSFDPLILDLMKCDPSAAWTYKIFPHLWPRITALDSHLQESRPWNIWVLFRDRRDSLQFWTFLFATLVVFLTFAQVALGIAQVVGSS